MSEKSFELQNLSLPLDDSWDVIVAGAGPAGATAAVAAARAGAKVLVIEAMGFAGGMGTAGLVPAWSPFSDGERVIYSGVAEEIFNASKEGVPHIKADSRDWVPIDPEHLKRVYDIIITESGAKLLFFTTMSSVQTDGNGNVEAIIVSNKSGLSALKAKVYVDCTGDGDLAAWAGAEYEKGGSDGTLQPATHCFSIGGIHEYSFRNGPLLYPGNPNSPAYDMRDDESFPLIKDVHLCNNPVGANAVGFNAGHLWGVDATDPESLTEAMLTGRELVGQMCDALKKYHPAAFAGSFVAATGSLMGIRETRRIIGDYYLTVDDYKERRSFDDEICRNSYFIDVHNTAEEGKKVKPGLELYEKRTLRYEKGESHGVPYRCLTPKGLKNVLVAGRSVSSDRLVNGSVRVMPVCLSMGQAAGEAAAMAASGDCDVHNVDTAKLRDNLKANGAYLP